LAQIGSLDRRGTRCQPEVVAHFAPSL